MNKNFLIDQANAVVVEQALFDLHNHYDLSRIEYRPQPKTLVLIFVRRDTKGSQVTFRFRDLAFLQFGPSGIWGPSEDLAEMGYKAPQDEVLDWLLTEEQAEPADHLVFRFAGDFFIRVHSSSAECLAGLGTV